MCSDRTVTHVPGCTVEATAEVRSADGAELGNDGVEAEVQELDSAVGLFAKLHGILQPAAGFWRLNQVIVNVPGSR